MSFTRRCAVFVLLAVSGCGLIFGGEDQPDAIDPVSADLAEFDALVMQLEQARTLELGPDAAALQTAGEWLAWLEGESVAEFSARKIPSGATIAGPVPIGDDQSAWNFRLSESHAMTAHRLDAVVVYQAWQLDDGALVDEIERAAPAGPGWSPYALLGDRAWLIEDQAGAHALLHWQLGVEPGATLGTLEQAGVEVGEVAEFGVIGPLADERLIVLTQGQLWLVEVAGWSATWIETETAVEAKLAWTDRDLLFTTADGGLHVLGLADGVRRRIDEELVASDWQLNDTFPDIHLPTGAGATLIGDRVVYLGSAGPFAYGLDDGVIAPVLLEARWDPTGEAPRIEYVDPLPLANSRLLVRGLEGSAGEIGSAGPVYSVELP